MNMSQPTRRLHNARWRIDIIEQWTMMAKTKLESVHGASAAAGMGRRRRMRRPALRAAWLMMAVVSPPTAVEAAAATAFVSGGAAHERARRAASVKQVLSPQLCQQAHGEGGDTVDPEVPLYVDQTEVSAASHHRQPLLMGANSLDESFEKSRISLLSDNVAPNGSADAKRINVAIVSRGSAFASLAVDCEAWDEGGVSSPLERVPGCVAAVNIRTALIGPRGRDGVRVDGNADALLSQGLLALLAEALAGPSEGGSKGEGANVVSVVTADQILELNPSSVAERLGLRSVLSPGRNDGLASMTKVVQAQIRLLLGEASEEEALGAMPSLSSERGQRPTVAMLLSGGVDSSVALNLLVREGYDVTAFYLKIWLEDELAHLGQCPWEDDYNICREVCEQAGVPLESISLQNQYKESVISYTVGEAGKGRTPNPDVMCNSRVKFGCFYDEIDGRGFDYVASGHYARLEEIRMNDDESAENAGKKGPKKTMRLLRAPDPIKDQTYFLCALTQDQLRRVKFPIGRYLKSEVRELAQQFNLPNRNRPDSQGLCFLGKVKFDEFMEAYLGTNPGDIVDAAGGRVIGRHNGLWYHTVGQRKGIGKVLNPIESSRGPWYIVAKDRKL